MICPHPSKNNPVRWRVQDKVLQEQKYFSFAQFGSKERAWFEAVKFSERLKMRRKARELRLSLDLNQLFDEYGRVRGVFFTKSNGRVILKAQFTQAGKQVSNTRTLHNRSLRDAYDELCDWLLESKDLKLTLDMKRLLVRSYRQFEMANQTQVSGRR
ncbi:hypothetical protein V4D09_02710 [Vibrio mimicus]|uniref:hypothetical protein n=1 Tax=Vibrio mimicus TaxID=674 RepID=UPI002F91E14B